MRTETASSCAGVLAALAPQPPRLPWRRASRTPRRLRRFPRRAPGHPHELAKAAGAAAAPPHPLDDVDLGRGGSVASILRQPGD